MQIMYRIQAGAQYLTASVEMAQIGPGVIPAGIAVTGRIQWPGIHGVL